jgi:hypothetical protein
MATVDGILTPEEAVELATLQEEEGRTRADALFRMGEDTRADLRVAAQALGKSALPRRAEGAWGRPEDLESQARALVGAAERVVRLARALAAEGVASPGPWVTQAILVTQGQVPRPPDPPP